MSEEPASLRQKNEFAALEAIYGEDLKDLRTKSGRRCSPLNFAISLNPQQGNSGGHEAYAKVNLLVQCDEQYPNSLPKVKLEKSKGLSNTLLSILQQKLEKKCKDLLGTEMIYELCQFVQEFLHVHNKPAEKSFYDQMLQRRMETAEKDLQAKLREENKQRQYMQEEVQKRHEMLKSESRLRREQRYNSETSNEECQSVSNNSESNGQLCNLDEHKKTVTIKFQGRLVQRGQCLKHCSCDHTVFIVMDLETGEILLLREWKIKELKYLLSLEQEFNYLMKLKDQSLVHYLHFKYDSDSDDSAVIYILQEFANGPQCGLFVNANFSISIQFIKYVSKGVLTALDFLHRNNVVHKDINEGCIFIRENGTVALSNYSLHRRLTDISQPVKATNYNKKTDIYKFGIFLLALLQGESVKEEHPEIPTSVPRELYDFLERCLAPSEKKRWSAVELLGHQFLCGDDVVASPVRNFDRTASPDVIANDLAQLQHAGQSRLEHEFEFVANLGKGAFGDVIKARNKLDGQFYAVKRIQLNPRNKLLNKKIVREVKLLSSLNHENIVRYYNSWIEKTVIKNDDSTDSSVASERRPRVVRHEEFSLSDKIEELAPPINSVELSCIYHSKSNAHFFTSDDSSSEDENWGAFNVESDSDSVQFEQDSHVHVDYDRPESKDANLDESVESDLQSEFMYIQMEFCERSTLRNAIDQCVYLNEERVWRLFREIIEGLAHIHQQGMIHRDLKPVNIFLDSNDHVKIGDFGLATNIKTLNDFGNSHPEKEENVDESRTGLVGTTLYVAPELKAGPKAKYNQKVDIYSLGIIFFEMCYRPLPTSMERIKILTGLRMKEILLPSDFADNQQRSIIKWLLTHEAADRPTSSEMLQSDRLPPPVMEDRELRELVRHTLSNPQLKGYRYLVASCFGQTLTPAQDITYDRDPSANSKPQRVSDFVREVIVKIFKQHGAVNLPTPLLMPKSQFYERTDSCVKLMTHFGGIVSLPHDLRVPFARYVASNGVTLLRRYSLERVYREKKVFGFLPRELYECAFDIVTSTPGNHLADAEILFVVYEIISELPGLRNKQVQIRLNHTGLIKGVLLHYGVKEGHQEVVERLGDVREGKMSKNDFNAFLAKLGLSSNNVISFNATFSSEFEVSKAITQLQNITKKRTEYSLMAKQALQELKSIAQSAEAFGVKFEMVVAPAAISNIQQYSGMMCQFVCEMKRKHGRENKEVLAAGGRYDAMIASYRKMMDHMQTREIRQSAVGISLALDKLVQAVVREESEELAQMDAVYVAVCSVGSKPLLREKTKILRTLWSVGIRCVTIEAANIEDIQEQCDELKVPHVILLKDSENLRLCSFERDRFQEKTFKVAELLENVQKLLKNGKEGPQESKKEDEKKDKNDNRNEKNESEANVIVLFETTEKLSANARKRYELQIRSNLDGLFKKLSGNVVVLACALECNVIRTISSYLEWENEHRFQTTVGIIVERHQRYKKYLTNICDEIFEHKCQKTKPVVVLFSLLDSFHRPLI